MSLSKKKLNEITWRGRPVIGSRVVLTNKKLYAVERFPQNYREKRVWTMRFFKVDQETMKIMAGLEKLKKEQLPGKTY